MSRSFSSVVLENRPVHKSHNLIILSAPDEMPVPQPGQFYMLQAGRGTDPLLKRPLSLFRMVDGSIQFLYRIRGKGTSLLADMKEGASIGMLGPLGNFYPVQSSLKIPLIVAGGIGVASVFSLVENIAGRAVVFYGARTKDDLMMAEEMRTYAKELVISTDDGSAGSKGNAAAALENYLASNPMLHQDLCIYACGPHPLLRAISDLAFRYRIRTYVSMEEHMACGIGACLGCVVNTRDGYKRVCKEGPVFSATEIIW